MLRPDLNVHNRCCGDSTAPIPSVIRHCQHSGLDTLRRTCVSGQMAGRIPNPRWLMEPGFAKPRQVLR